MTWHVPDLLTKGVSVKSYRFQFQLLFRQWKKLKNPLTRIASNRSTTRLLEIHPLQCFFPFPRDAKYENNLRMIMRRDEVSANQVYIGMKIIVKSFALNIKQ